MSPPVKILIVHMLNVGKLTAIFIMIVITGPFHNVPALADDVLMWIAVFPIGQIL